MTIQALPQTTVRAIGASQVLTDPAAVVKELIDNALDARATSIAVEIHANTLDVIQVRDNGHGIPPQDRPLVARRYCTSKLINEHDLTAIGGSTLGFRGEALASAAEMSGGMTVTTRVEGEQVATTLKISQQGEVLSQERASTAVGTTVKITDFIKSNPVRRQVALKHTDQCLKRVKHMLQAYAFSRPHVRLSLRVLKAKIDKGSWMYAPKTGGNAEDAAFKIVGAACASQCIWSVIEEDGFSLHAFLPKPDAAINKISNIGSFISIDRRPVTSQRNVSKQIIRIFRENLKSANPQFDGVKEPFLFLDIGCPEQSYDPNIEPAKDDVLFEEPDKVVEAVRILFSAVYQAQQPAQISVQEPTAGPLDSIETLLGDDDDDHDDDTALITMLHQAQANKPSQSAGSRIGSAASAQEQDLQDQNAVCKQNDPFQRAFRSNMYDRDEDEFDMVNTELSTARTELDFEDLQQARNDVSISNPWVMAKLNAPKKQTQIRPSETFSTSQTKTQGEVLRDDRVPDIMSLAPLTPRASSLTPSEQPFHPSNHVPDLRLANDGRVVELHEPSQRPCFDTPAHSSGAPVAIMTPSPSQHPPRPDYNYGIIPQSDAQQGTPLSAIPLAKTRETRSTDRQAQISRPFVSPVVSSSPKEKVWFDHLEGIEERGYQRPRRRNPVSRSTGLVHQGEMEVNERPLTPPTRNRDIREFVASVDLTGDTPSRGPHCNGRTDQASTLSNRAIDGPETQDENVPNNYGAISGRGFVPASELAALEARLGSLNKPMSPHPKRRKTGDKPLRQISGNAPPSAYGPEDDQEYRPESTNRRRSSAKVHRTKSSHLPLERVPAGKGTHDLVTRLSIRYLDVATQVQAVELGSSILGWNEPAVEAYDVFADERTQQEVQAMSAKLHELLINRVSDGEVVQDLSLLVRNALTAHAARTTAEEEEEEAAL